MHLRHRHSTRRNQLIYAVAALLAAVILVSTAVAGLTRAGMPAPLERRAEALFPKPAAKTSPSPAPTPTPAPTPQSQAAPIAALAAGLPAGSVSVAARNLVTGATFTYGTAGGQDTASIVKVDILETLLLQKQASGSALTPTEQSEATAMIEDSDDDAATYLWEDEGEGAAVAAANTQLGVPCTVPGSEDYWGLTTTCAQGQVQLLNQLESASSPLNASHRSYILSLMQSVTPSQTWGVPVAADSGTAFGVKNGWLNLTGDTDWVINSDGIVTYHGQTLLISVLTMHNATMASGVQLVQQIAPLAAQSVAL